MKKVLTWILGILIGLAIIAVIAGAVFMVTNRARGFAWMSGSRLTMRNWEQRAAPNQVLPRQRNPGQMMPRFNEQNEMPMMYYGRMGYYPFGGFRLIGGLIGGLFKLFLLGLVIFFAVTLAVRHDRSRQQAVHATPAVAKTSCSQCGREVESDWKHCPYCGNSLETSQSDTPEA